MAIQILPARLANQIAAGEVVERPASVVKELIENSLDAGATQITIDIEKGGAKRIKITDNGKGIVKEELTLALSRHATSKIKSLDDLEAIASLGFRGEALASISSVSRLTLTSKPVSQENAWQAVAEGRDMDVNVTPAAHPNGTSIDVQDLFFNTPARRKFLRTEKTEFNHIEEVVKRVALAEFNVSFTLNHNGKKIRQFRAISDKAQYIKRIAAVCGKPFIDQVIPIDCQHHDIHLWGWVANPGYYRSHNDMCYSYVNGRMMRDKLINHAIRQAFAHRLPESAYPAFVLYLELDHKEVDVNVHPAKHEVRFHQGRYVHDFIFSVIEKSLGIEQIPAVDIEQPLEHNQSVSYTQPIRPAKEQEAEYITPLSYQQPSSVQQATTTGRSGYNGSAYQRPASHRVISESAVNYQSLMTTPEAVQEKLSSAETNDKIRLLSVLNDTVALIQQHQSVSCISLKKLATKLLSRSFVAKIHEGIISQPLLIPIAIKLSESHIDFISENLTQFQLLGFHLSVSKQQVQLRQCPPQLRNKDVSGCFTELLEQLISESSENVLADVDWCTALANVASQTVFDMHSGQTLLVQAKSELKSEFSNVIDLISVTVDLTSSIKRAQE